MKDCISCKETLPATSFSKSGNYLRSDCRKCAYAKKKAWVERNREHVKAYQEKWIANGGKEFIAQWAKDNAERMKELQRNWREKKPERQKARRRKEYVARQDQYRAYAKAKREENPEYSKSHSRAFKARFRPFTPPWADREAIRAVYDECARRREETGEDLVVDHIMPLNGKNVSGLHVHGNLRIITRIENTSKHNRIIPSLLGDGGERMIFT